jgi:hypothetical protein
MQKLEETGVRNRLTPVNPACRVLDALLAHDFVAFTCRTAGMTALTRLALNENDIPSTRHQKLVRELKNNLQA